MLHVCLGSPHALDHTCPDSLFINLWVTLDGRGARLGTRTMSLALFLWVEEASNSDEYVLESPGLCCGRDS